MAVLEGSNRAFAVRSTEDGRGLEVTERDRGPPCRILEARGNKACVWKRKKRKKKKE